MCSERIRANGGRRVQNETGTTATRSRRGRKARRRAAKRAAQERAQAAAETDLAASALLADPATIAGVAAPTTPPAEPSEGVLAEVPIPKPTAARGAGGPPTWTSIRSTPPTEPAAPPDRAHAAPAPPPPDAAEVEAAPPPPDETEVEAAPTPPDETEVEAGASAADPSGIDRLREALRLQSDDLASLRQRWRSPSARASSEDEDAPDAGPDATADADATSDGVPVASHLMDAHAARRLAADARERERASREALAQARRAIGHAPAPAANDADEASDATPHAAAVDAGAAETLGTLAAPHRAEAATRDDPELAELRSLLAFARETASRQRDALQVLRERVATLEAAAPAAQTAPTTDPIGAAEAPLARSAPGEAPSPTTAAETRDVAPADAGVPLADLARLRTRLEESEAENARHRREKAVLEETLEERTRQLALRREELDALRDRFDAQDRALDAARREYELERARHGRTLDTLAELQRTLSRALPDDAPREAAGPPAIATAGGLQAVAPETTPPSVAPAVGAGDPATASTPSGWTTVPLDVGATAGTAAEAAPRRRSAIGLGSASGAYAHWLDERVRSRFGPLGAERFVDLFRDADRRAVRVQDAGRTLLVIARGASSVAARFAEDLLRSGASRFSIHYVEAPTTSDGDRTTADASSNPARTAELPLAFDSPLRDHLVEVDAIRDADALAGVLEALRPDAIVCHDFLSHATDVAPWLDRLLAETRDGATLVLAERAGLAPSEPPAAIGEVAERLWARLPERYTRAHPGGAPLGPWRAAFEAAVTRPANGLLEALRARAPLALADRFGYLALTYVDSPIADNFDARSDRDRRFLAQLADLDERRIEGGEAPALAFVARVDPAAVD